MPLFTLGRLLVHVANAVVPRPLAFYCHGEPTLQFDGARVGMARFLGPPPDPAQRPTTFVCNVGNLVRGHDAVIVGKQTKRMADSLGGARGFLGQYLCDIPVWEPQLTKGGHHRGHWSDLATGFFAPAEYKQLNLTAWDSPQSAHDWYVHNKDHEDIVHAHRSGLLSSFSSLLVSLAPARKPRWDARCQICTTVNPNYPDSLYCANCGARSPDMPLF